MTTAKFLKSILSILSISGVIALTVTGNIHDVVISPVIGLVRGIGLRQVAIIPVLTLLFCTVFYRVFCRFGCPLGAMFFCIDWLRKKIKFSGISCRFFPDLKYFFLLTILAGVVFGIPAFLFLDPLILLYGLFTLNKYSVGLYLIPLLLIAAFFMPRVWCLKICPLGALQELFYLKRYKRLLQIQTSDLPAPDLHATAVRRKRLIKTILTFTGIGLWITAAKQADPLQSDKFNEPKSSLPVPPGSIDNPAMMAATCARCSKCVSVCPTGLIRPVRREESLVLWGTPRLDWQANNSSAYCDSNCNRCTQYCPTGAIAPLTIQEKNQVILAVVNLDFSLCLLNFDRECQICVRECPNKAIESQWSEEQYLQTIVINHDLCNGCGRCVAFCPSSEENISGDNPAVSSRRALSISEYTGST